MGEEETMGGVGRVCGRDFELRRPLARLVLAFGLAGAQALLIFCVLKSSYSRDVSVLLFSFGTLRYYLFGRYSFAE